MVGTPWTMLLFTGSYKVTQNLTNLANNGWEGSFEVAETIVLVHAVDVDPQTITFRNNRDVL